MLLETTGPISGGTSGAPSSFVDRESPSRGCGPTGLALPSHGAYARLKAMYMAANDTAQRRGACGALPLCESGATGSLPAVPNKTKRPRADGKGPSAQSRG